MARKRQPAPRPSTRVRIGEQEREEAEREAGEQRRRAIRRSALLAHLEAINKLYETYDRVHPEERTAFRKQLAADDGGAEFNRWLNGDRQGEPPPIHPLPPIPRLLAELGMERRKIVEEVRCLDLAGCASDDERKAAVVGRLLVQRGWSSPQIAEAMIPDADIEGSKTFELKDTKEARQASRVRARFCKSLREELVRIRDLRKLHEQRTGEVDETMARAEFDRMKAARRHETAVTLESRAEHERMFMLAVLVDLDGVIKAIEAKLADLEQRGMLSQGRGRGRAKIGRPRRK